MHSTGKHFSNGQVESAKLSACKPIIVVLGANADSIDPIAGTATIQNNDWQEGMASSIRAGISEINQNDSIDAVIIMLCDQPFVSPELLNSLINKQAESGKLLVACAYNDTTGVPVLFHRTFFNELLSLKGLEGAKKILKDHINEIATVPFEQGSIDIDTLMDYEKLLKLGN